jgi:hypothetical protein
MWHPVALDARRKMLTKLLLAAILLAAAGSVSAIEPFNPLNSPAVVGVDGWKLASGWQAEMITDRNTLSLQPGFQASFGRWDMLDIGGANHEYIYLPFEVPNGAGVARYDRDAATSTTLMGGNGTGVFAHDPVGWSATADDFGSIDPAVLTPTGTLVVAEETSGAGRIFEITNPETATGTGDAVVQWLSNIPSVAHEGIKFDGQGRMYFIDENYSGSIYRYTPAAPGDLTQGKVDTLVINAYAGDPALNWNVGANFGATRTGAASWIEIVDSGGAATTIADPFDFASRGGRAAADEVNGTPYGRPEDLVIATVNGDEILYFATTAENVVYGINLATDVVFEAVNSLVTPDNLGNNPVGKGATDANYGLDDVDNLEFAFGPGGELQLFIIEDENPGDVWMATDTNGDGVADYIDLFISLGVSGSEPTGFRTDPRGGFLLCIQHPAGGNDSLWRISMIPVLGTGDINDDGSVNVADLLLLQRGLIGEETLDAAQTGRADLHPVGGNDALDASDLIALQNILMR